MLLGSIKNMFIHPWKRRRTPSHLPIVIFIGRTNVPEPAYVISAINFSAAE